MSHGRFGRGGSLCTHARYTSNNNNAPGLSAHLYGSHDACRRRSFGLRHRLANSLPRLSRVGHLHSQTTSRHVVSLHRIRCSSLCAAVAPISSATTIWRSGMRQTVNRACRSHACQRRSPTSVVELHPDTSIEVRIHAFAQKHSKPSQARSRCLTQNSGESGVMIKRSHSYHLKNQITFIGPRSNSLKTGSSVKKSL